jgi:hypothetical protein
MSESINPLSMMATAPMSSNKNTSGSWYQAMAEAWGQTLDRQAADIESLADKVSGGDDKPATVTQLTAASLKMGFLSSSSQTALSSTGEALKTMAQKS